MALFVGGVFLIVAAVAAAIFGKKHIPYPYIQVVGGSILAGLVGLALVVFSTTLYVGDKETGIIIVKFGKDLPAGQIIATQGEKGPQARVLPPGWHFWYWPWLYKLETVNTQVIKEGMVGTVVAKDGLPLPEGETFAQKWGDVRSMLDGQEFLTSGQGYRGPQLTVLPPGEYRYNPRLFEIRTVPALEVQVGEVAVIKANAGPEFEGEGEEVNGVPIVPVGYRGIWQEALTPQLYYLHPSALIPTRVRTTNRIYSYTSSGDGGANNPIGVRSKDGFEFPVDVRVSVKITAENAPYCVALLKDPDSDSDGDGYDTLEERVVLPSIRAIFRNSAEQRDALEYVNTRSEIEKSATQQFAQQLERFKVNTDGVFVADIGLSETTQGKQLLATQTEKEIALREKDTWQQKMEAEMERAKTVRAEEEANQEKDKAQARARIDINQALAEAAIAEAEGQKQVYLKKIEALGGVDNFVRLEVTKMVLEGLENVELPEVLVVSGGAEDGSGAMDALVARMLQQAQREKQARDSGQ